MFAHTEVSWDEWLLAWTAEEAGEGAKLADRVAFPLVPTAAPTPITRRIISNRLAAVVSEKVEILWIAAEPVRRPGEASE